MRVRALDGSESECLEYARQSREIRIEVAASAVLAPVDGLYFVREASLWLLWNYLREIGVRGVIAKVRSRQAERARNRKYVGIGYGWVIESDEPRLAPGRRVCYVAPRHPAHVDRLSLVPELLTLFEWSLPFECESTVGAWAQDPASEACSWVADVAGWDPHSGTPCRTIEWEEVQRTLHAIDWSGASRFARSPSIGSVVPGSATPRGDALGATLFGYGNYAKTVLLPALPPPLVVTRVHEIDPLQIPARRGDRTWDTAPEPASEDRNRVWFIAGYHHTHATLAVLGLASGRAVVSEKPLVTTREQATALEQALEGNAGRYFGGFHKRYSPFNVFAKQDLGATGAEPISYHCIVYEVPLPRRHWYRWPNSGSRIVSNGCHWLDHFLFLNGYCAHSDASLVVGTDGELNVSVLLANGAFLSLLLTDRGSPRVGMREYLELRAGSCTVCIADGATYRAESARRVLRRTAINKMQSYRSMYATIARRIIDGEPGDSLDSVRRTNALMLDLDDQFGDLHR